MKVIFTDINWRNSEDNEVFNISNIKSITLEGMKNGIITIEGESNTLIFNVLLLILPRVCD